MGVSVKTENEGSSGKSVQIRGSQGGRRGFTGISMQSLHWQIPHQPSARLTHGLERATGQRPLRFSVLTETPMTFSCDYFKKLKCYEYSDFNKTIRDDFLYGADAT